MLRISIYEMERDANKRNKSQDLIKTETFNCTIEGHIACFSGDRRFKQWNGSVVESVVGVFLTQNVADHLSSAAYMSLVAKFPVRSTSIQQESMTVDGQPPVKLCNSQGSQLCDQRACFACEGRSDPEFTYSAIIYAIAFTFSCHGSKLLQDKASAL
ncbi:hypothetical protein POTOM_013575 [Populus tomentosa]|uniref:Uncharacterized protein n=1 Tax=Populus tomentosa TaxID=118781 RepID=A0A8X8A682_POPTO|nr:hypothetical protein POTOM_013575 [Populus tomentosa]